MRDIPGEEGAEGGELFLQFGIALHRVDDHPPHGEEKEEGKHGHAEIEEDAERNALCRPLLPRLYAVFGRGGGSCLRPFGR